MAIRPPNTGTNRIAPYTPDAPGGRTVQQQIQDLIDQGYSLDDAETMVTGQSGTGARVGEPGGTPYDQSTSYLGNDPDQQMRSNRTYLYGQGAILNQDAKDRAAQQRQQRGFYDEYADTAYDPLIAGQGGFNWNEQADILRENELRGGAATDEDYERNFLTGDEFSASMGNPWDRAVYFNPDWMTSLQMDSEGNQRGAVAGMRGATRDAVGNLRTGMEGAIRPDDLRLSGGYGTSAEGALSGTEGAVRGAIDPTKLGLRAGFLEDYEMTPEEQQRIVTGAGITTGNVYRDQSDQLERRARAAGLDPLGVAAAKQRLVREGAGEAGDAMTQARIGADSAAAARLASGEGMRLGAEQTQAGMRVGSELALGGRRLGQVNEGELMRLKAEQGLSDRQLLAARTSGMAALENERVLGQTGLQSEQAINNQARNQAQYNATTGTAIATGIEADTAARNYELARQRAATNAANVNTRFGQGRQISADLSGRSLAIAAQRRREAAEGRAYLTGRGIRANANEQAEYERQMQLHGTTASLANQGTDIQRRWNDRTKTWEKVAGLAIGAVGAFMGGGGGTRPKSNSTSSSNPYDWGGYGG